ACVVSGKPRLRWATLGSASTGRSGGSLVLDCANDCGEYGPARATGNRLRENAGSTQIARLRCRHDRWHQQLNDLTEQPASDQTGNDIADRTKIKGRGGFTCADATNRSRDEIDQDLLHLELPVTVTGLDLVGLSRVPVPPRPLKMD